MTLKCLEQGIDTTDPANEARIGQVASQARIRFPSLGSVELDGRNVTDAIRTSTIVRHINQVASNPAVRRALAEQQRALARGEDRSAWPNTTGPKGVVMDGRDIGTVILPDAELKVFIVADVKIRAQRRFEELKNKEANENITLEAVMHDLMVRDEADRTRKISPLKQADDAVVLDTSHKTIDEQVSDIERLVYERLGKQ